VAVASRPQANPSPVVLVAVSLMTLSAMSDRDSVVDTGQSIE